MFLNLEVPAPVENVYSPYEDNKNDDDDSTRPDIDKLIEYPENNY